MPLSQYTYTIATDFPNNLVNSDRLTLEIIATAIVPVLDHIDTENGFCDIFFQSALSVGEQTTLDGVVAVHSGAQFSGQVLYGHTGAPTFADDFSEENTTGQIWVDQPGGRAFVNISPTPIGSAIWLSMGGGSPGPTGPIGPPGPTGPQGPTGLNTSAHEQLRQLIHFIDDGPGFGFASGAYREVSGVPFPTAITWYESSNKTAKIVEKLISLPLIAPTGITWNMYGVGGTPIVQTIGDRIVYTGIFEISRTRAI